MDIKRNPISLVSLILLATAVPLLFTGCLSAQYTDKTGALIEVHSFLRKAALSDLEVKIGTGSIKIGTLKGQGDAQTIAELRGLLGDLQAAAAKVAVPIP